MTTKHNASASPLMWASTIAIVLFASAGVAAFMGWLPTSYGQETSATDAKVTSAKSVQKSKAQSSSSNQKLAINTPVKAICVDCGVIESVRAIDDVKETSGFGLVGGAVVGGLLGSQVGGGRGKDVATVAGAVGGAVAGNEIEKNSGRTRHYEITVLFDDGSRRVFNEANPPVWQSGDEVRVIDGSIRSNG